MNIIEVKGLSKHYGKIKAVDDISFTIAENEIVGFVGPNGAGKTTTLKLITDLVRPTGGEIAICGYSLKKQREKALANVAGIIEMPGLYQNLTGKENLRFVQKIYGVSKQMYQEMADLTGLDHHLTRSVSGYSLGMKQRLALGMSMMKNPKLLILDEPTNGLDPTGTLELRARIKEISKQTGTSVLFSSHMLSEVEKIADRVLYIKNGKLITPQATGITEKIYQFLVSDPCRCTEILTQAYPHMVMEQDQSSVSVTIPKTDCLNDILTTIIQNKINIQEIIAQQDNMENKYRTMFTQE